MAERPPLNPEEAALWRRVTETVAPLPGRREKRIETAPLKPAAKRMPRAPAGIVPAPAIATAKPAANTLDGSWDRRLARGGVSPDRIIDLHGETLDHAYALIDTGLDAAIRGGERVLLLVTGKVRPDARPGKQGTRGAIRAVIHDWLAHSRHAAAIAAVRAAHPRHGGGGALYVILRKR